jgi:hypothetical protein
VESPWNCLTNHPLVLAHQGTLSSSQADHDIEVLHDGTLSTSSAEAHFSSRAHNGCRAVPSHPKRSTRFNSASAGGIMPSWTSSSISSLPVLNEGDSPRPSEISRKGSRPEHHRVDSFPRVTTMLDPGDFGERVASGSFTAFTD